MVFKFNKFMDRHIGWLIIFINCGGMFFHFYNLLFQATILGFPILMLFAALNFYGFWLGVDSITCSKVMSFQHSRMSLIVLLND